MEEKRTLSRVLFHMRAHMKKGEQEFTGEVENLSLRGLLVKLSEGSASVKPQDQLEVTIDLAGSSSGLFIHVKTEVLRVESDGSLALHIRHMDPDTFIHLKNILAYNSGDYDKIIAEFMKSLQE